MYVRTFEIDNIKMMFYLEEYELLISGTEGKQIGWSKLKAIISNGWIQLEDYSGNIIYGCIQDVEYLNLYEYKLFLQFYLIDYYRGDKQHTFEFDHIWIKSDCLDYFFRNNDVYKNDITRLMNSWNGEESYGVKLERNAVEVNVFNTKILIRFKTMMQGSNKPFPYDIRNVMEIEIEKTSDVELLANLLQMVKTFFGFIAVSQKVDIVNPIVIGCGDDINAYTMMVYMKPDNAEYINPNRCLTYEDTENGLSELFTMICNDEICFRSLFPSNINMITYADIMNICAAFELQFKTSVKKNYRYKEQDKVKKKMIKIIEESRETLFSDEEKIYFDEIFAGMKNVTETLKKRIDIVQNDFLEIYGEQNVKFDFEDDYINMPERIKNSRNALDHGNVSYRFENIMYRDAELLRAMVYMLILKSAGISEKSKLFNSIKKLSKYPI